MRTAQVDIHSICKCKKERNIKLSFMWIDVWTDILMSVQDDQDKSVRLKSNFIVEHDKSVNDASFSTLWFDGLDVY